jgi:hypothetical protein
MISRLILIMAAAISTILVQVLSRLGFSIVDLVFAIYGAQLGLCPLVITALLLKRDKLRRLRGAAVLAVSMGFVAGWASAIYGHFADNTNMVFLAPVISLLISSLLVAIGFVIGKKEK